MRLSFGSKGIGERGDEVYTVCHHGIAAVLSDSPIRRYEVSRDNLIPHELVIEEVMRKHAVLPARFGTIAEGEEKIKRILEKEHDRFSGLLKYIEGKKELGLKAMFKKDNIYTDIIEKNKDIRKMKQTLASMPPQA
ncbi:MAG: GvpL/GvpF family gas vesicle protein, partial [Pseudomonadota bacterium]